MPLIDTICYIHRYVGARFVSLVLEERSRARAVEEAEAEGIPVDQDMGKITMM